MSSATAAALVGLAVSATTSRPRAPPSQPAATTVWPLACAAARACVELGGQVLAPLGEQARPAGDDGVAVDDALDAEALAVLERLDRRQLADLARAPRRRWRGRSGARRRPRARRRAAAARPRSPSPATMTSRTCIRPVVTVPVLSSTIVSTRRVDSSTSGPLIRMPSCAPRPVPTSSAVGVASPSAHGQAMISTATAVVIAKAALAPPPSQKPSVATARAITIGHEDRRDAIGQPLDGRLAGLRLASRAGRSGRARCRRRPSSRARRGGRRR